MEKDFREIYNSRHWGNDNEEMYNGSSGPGSEIWYNIEYIQFLQNFIITNHIQNVVDLGSGNCKCLKIIYDNLNINYVGYDVYKEVIDYNIELNSNNKYSFIHSDFFKNKHDIVKADLCIIKDVLMHWKLSSIYEFMDYIVDSNKFKYILIINCCNQIEDNTDVITNGNFRALSANYLPLKKYNLKILHSYNSKEISLISL